MYTCIQPTDVPNTLFLYWHTVSRYLGYILLQALFLKKKMVRNISSSKDASTHQICDSY